MNDYECGTSCTLCLAHLGSHKLKASREYAGGLASLVINPNMFRDVISIITDIAKVNRKHATIHRTIDSSILTAAEMLLYAFESFWKWRVE